MDIEEIKIEPLNIVKKELNVDGNANLEVKLENEEKPDVYEELSIFDEQPIVVKAELKFENEDEPQTMKEVASGEYQHSKTDSVQKYDTNKTNSHTCCYCGENRKSEEMVQLPESENELFKWVEFLGQNLYEIVFTSLMICRRHFDDEFGDSRLVEVICENQIIETRIGTAYKCCYCGRSRIARSMTTVPKDEYLYIKWVKTLGQKFYEHTKRKSNRGYICRSHFETEWQEFNPEELLPVADLSEDPAEVKSEENLVIRKAISENKRTCDYCEKLKPRSDLTQVPQNPRALKNWRDILGVNFYRRTLSKKQSSICRSHFNVEWKGIRPRELLPVADLYLNSIKKEHKDRVLPMEKHTCDYCKEMKHSRYMTWVPQNLLVLKEWGDILGEEFYKRASSKARSSICRSHFDVEWENRRPTGLLPCTNVVRQVELKKSDFENAETNSDNNFTRQKLQIETIQEKFFGQDGPFDTKMIKIEVKEEEEE